MSVPDVESVPVTSYHVFYCLNPSKYLDKDCSYPTAPCYPQAIPIDVYYIVSRVVKKRSYIK